MTHTLGEKSLNTQTLFMNQPPIPCTGQTTSTQLGGRSSSTVYMNEEDRSDPLGSAFNDSKKTNILKSPDAGRGPRFSVGPHVFRDVLANGWVGPDLTDVRICSDKGPSIQDVVTQRRLPTDLDIIYHLRNQRKQ